MTKCGVRGLVTMKLVTLLLVGVVVARTSNEQGVGSIRGIVTVADSVDATLRMVDVTADQSVCGERVEDRVVVVDPSGGLANAVIIVTGVPWNDTKPEPVINNSGCYFVPRVQVAATRSVVMLTSEDDVLHTTHAYDDRQRTLFNIAIPLPGLEIERPLRRPGPVRIECDSHGWMRGWVYVTDDIGTVTTSNGQFELADIPAGSYELTVWHEQFTGKSQHITVSPDGQTEASFTLQ
ncbi:MAG: carboxypeptidase regulatory-like domain-containing protein [Vicinamibacterales bacterium]|jgi:hypothetical protein